MDNQVKVIKFENGETVVATMEEDFTENNFVKILYPIEIISEAHLKGEQVIEKYSMKPWISLSDETLMSINSRRITTVVDLKEEFVEGYERMINVLFFETEVEHETVEEEIETLMQYAEAQKDNKIS